MNNNAHNTQTKTVTTVLPEYAKNSVPVVARHTLRDLDDYESKEENNNNPIKIITTNDIIPTSRTTIASSSITIETFRIGWEDLVSSMPTRNG